MKVRKKIIFHNNNQSFFCRGRGDKNIEGRPNMGSEVERSLNCLR